MRFSEPCVLDIKLGTQTYEPTAPSEKRMLELAKYPAQAVLGFRIVGMRVYCANSGTYRQFDRSYGRQLDADRVVDGLREFLDPGPGHSLRLDVAHQLVSRVQSLIAFFERHQLDVRFYASSILIVYDGRKNDAGDADVEVRLIDFAHTVSVDRAAHDEGCLHGLRRLHSTLLQICRT